MKFYLPARSENLDFFGVVDVNAEYEEWLLTMRDHFLDIHKKEESLACLVFWDLTIDWYENGCCGEDAALLIEQTVRDDCEVTRLPDDFEMSPSSTQASIELGRVVVDDRGFYWKCFPKHCNEMVVSDMIEWGELNHAEGTTNGEVRDAAEQGGTQGPPATGGT